MKVDTFFFGVKKSLLSVVIFVISMLCVLSPTRLFADAETVNTALIGSDLITFDDSTHVFTLPKLHESSSLYPIMQALPNPLGAITPEYLQDKKINFYFAELKEINYNKLAGGMWLRFSLKGSDIKKKRLFLNMGSYTALPISLFIAQEMSTGNSFRKVGDFETNRLYLETENAQEEAIYTYYIGIQNIPSPLFIPILENSSVDIVENISIFKLLVITTIGVSILITLLRVVIQKAYPFLWLIVYKSAILLSISLGIVKTSTGFIDLSSLPIVFVFAILVIIYPFLGKILLHKNSAPLPKKYQNIFLLFTCIGAVIALLPQIPTMAWLSRYIVLWPLILLLWIPFIVLLLTKKYTNSLLYFLSSFIPIVCICIALSFNVNMANSFIYTEVLLLVGMLFSSIILSMVSMPKRTVYARKNVENSDSDKTSMPYWMQELPENTQLDLPEEETVSENLFAVTSLEDIYEDEGYIVKDSLMEEEEISDSVSQEYEEIIDELEEHTQEDTIIPVHIEESQPKMIKERVLEAMKREPNIMKYSPRELFIYLYRALKPYSEAYNVDLSWFVDPDLQEDQEHDSDVIYSTLYSIGESLIINNPNSNMHIGAKKITDTHLPSHVRFSIMIMPEGTLHNFQSDSIASIAELIAIAGGTLFMGNAQGKKMEMIVTLPAMAKVLASDEERMPPPKLAPFVNEVPDRQEKDLNLVAFASAVRINEEFEETHNTVRAEGADIPQELLDEIDSINLDGLEVQRSENIVLEEDEGEEIEELKKEIQEILAESIQEKTEDIEENVPVARFTEDELREEISEIFETNEETIIVEEDVIIPIGFVQEDIHSGDVAIVLQDIDVDSSNERRRTKDKKVSAFVENKEILEERKIPSSIQKEEKPVAISIVEERKPMPPIEKGKEKLDIVSEDNETKIHSSTAVIMEENSKNKQGTHIPSYENNATKQDPEPIPPFENIKTTLQHDESAKNAFVEENEEENSEIEEPVIPTSIMLPSFEEQEKNLEYTPNIPSKEEKDAAIKRIGVQDAKVAHTPAYMKERDLHATKGESFTESIRSSMQEMIDTHSHTQYKDIVPVFSEVPSIIIANGDKNDRRLTAYFLEGLAYTIAEVDTTEALLDYHRHYPAHLVIIDTTGSEDTLKDVIYDLHEIDRSYATPPVLVLSIARSMHFISTLEKAGSVATMSKPVNRVALRDLVVQLLPEVKELASNTSEQWDQKDVFEPKDFSSAQIGTTDAILPAKPSVMKTETDFIEEMLEDSTNTLSAALSARKGVEEETLSISQSHVESIPYFLNALQSLMGEAEQAMRLRNCYKIAEIATKLARENANFGLKSMEKTALCIRRAAEAMDMDAVEGLFNELALDMEKVIAILAKKYDERE